MMIDNLLAYFYNNIFFFSESKAFWYEKHEALHTVKQGTG
jgi:hypothetical protein